MEVTSPPRAKPAAVPLPTPPPRAKPAAVPLPTPPPRAKPAATTHPTPSPGLHLTPNPPSPCPSRGRGRPRPTLIAALVSFLLAAPALHADYREPYKRGLDAIAGKRWDEAARQMRLAIGERPEAAAGLLGTSFRRYTPHYYLGVALAEQGECRGAVEALDAAEKQGKLSKEEVRDLTEHRQACRNRVQKSTEAVATAQREVDAAAAAAFQVAGVEGAPLMRDAWREGSPSFAARHEPATAQLAAARALLARAEQELDAEKAAEAGRSAQAARRDLEALFADATARRDQLQAEAQREMQALRKSIAEARRRVGEVSRTLAPLPATIAGQAERVEEALTRAAAADAGTTATELRGLQDALKASLRELQAAVKPPPDELQRAAAAYFGGDFAGALAALSATPFIEPRAAAHACLLRAAALHGLAVLQPGKDGSANRQTRDELHRCLASPAAVKPLATVFPPSFVALYAEVAAEPRPPG